jgi:hypothetical protein
MRYGTKRDVGGFGHYLLRPTTMSRRSPSHSPSIVANVMNTLRMGRAPRDQRSDYRDSPPAPHPDFPPPPGDYAGGYFPGVEDP